MEGRPIVREWAKARLPGSETTIPPLRPATPLLFSSPLPAAWEKKFGSLSALPVPVKWWVLQPPHRLPMRH